MSQDDAVGISLDDFTPSNDSKSTYGSSRVSGDAWFGGDIDGAGVEEASLPPEFDSLVAVGDADDKFLEEQDVTVDMAFDQKVCGCLDRANPVRNIAIAIVSSKIFKYFMLAVIVLNVLYFAFLEGPTLDKENVALFNLVLACQIIFSIIFWLEMILKIVAVGPLSYVRNGWNLLDMFLNIYGLISLIPDVANLNIIRTFRVLNVLRLFGSLRGFRAIINAILFSVPHLMDVALLIIFLFFVFGLTGMQTWMGEFRQRCVDDVSGQVVVPDRLCSVHTEFSGRVCPADTHCSKNATLTGDNPSHGYMGFDNLGMALLTLYSMSSTDGWSNIMYYAMDIDGYPVWVFFVGFIIVCTLFGLNLFVAVITSKYQQYARQDREMRRREKMSESVKEATKGPTSGCRYALKRIIKHKSFSGFIFGSILVNTVFLAMDHYGISDGFRLAINIVNFAFTGIFTLEAILKIIAFGPVKYFSKKWNWFDFGVIILALVDLVLGLVLQYPSFLNVLRTVRILRIFELIPLWYSLERVLRAVLSIQTVAFLTITLLFFQFIFALIGRQLFYHKMTFPEGVPRWNFDNLWWSFVTTWQVMNGDTWTDVLYDGLRVTPLAAPFFVIVYGLGSFMLLRLYTGVLLDKFSQVPDKVVVDKSGQIKLIEDHVDAAAEEDLSDSDTEETDDPVELEAKRKNRKQQLSARSAVVLKGIKKIHIVENTEVSLEKSRATTKKYVGKSLNLFWPENPFRRFCITMFTAKSANYVLVGFILANCASLIFDSADLEIGSAIWWLIQVQDIFFGFIFVLELIGKIIAFGFVRGPTAYLRPSKGWNIADACVIIMSLLTIFVPTLSQFRAIRAFRILRVLSRFESSKVATRAFLSTLPAAGNVGFVVGIVWIIFGILGVNLYKGTFWRCTDPLVDTQDECYGYFINSVGSNSTREWFNPPYNFDHLGNAMLALFQVSTREGGIDVMYAAVDARGVGLNPKRDSSPTSAIFFIAFAIIGCNYALNLLAGSVVDSFNRKKKRFEGFAFLSAKQKQWLATQKILIALRPPKPIKAPKKSNRMAFFYLVESIWFRAFMVLVIVCNLIALSLRHYGMTEAMENAINVANHIFLAFYTLEVILKLIGLGPTQYFGVPSEFSWNKFEFFIVVSWLGVMVAGFQAESPLVRLLRALPVIRLVKGASRLHVVFDTLIYSLPSMTNVGILLFVVYYIYAVVGMHSMGQIVFQSRDGINEQANFRTFGSAMLTLFRISTLDNWVEVMWDSWVIPPLCSYEAGNCGSGWNTVYFVSFIVIQSYIMFNLVLAILLENYEEFMKVDKYSKWTHFRRLIELWKRSDPASIGKVDAGDVVKMLMELGAPLGFTPNMSRVQILREFQKMNIPINRNGMVYYEHFLRATTMRSLIVNISNLEIEDEKLAKLSGQTMAHWWAAEIIQRKWRKEAPDIKLRQMGRYDELLNTRGNIGTLTRALAILERQDKRFVSATNNSGALELADVLNDDTLYQLFSRFYEKNQAGKREMQFIKDLREFEFCKDEYKAYQLAMNIARTYLAQGLKLLSISTREQKHLREGVTQYLDSIKVLANAPFTQIPTSLSGGPPSRSSRSKSSTQASSAPPPPAVVDRAIFATAKTAVLDTLRKEIFPRFLEWDIFASYCKNQVKTAMFLQLQNSDLIRQIVEAQAERDRLQRARGLIPASTASEPAAEIREM